MGMHPKGFDALNPHLLWINPTSAASVVDSFDGLLTEDAAAILFSDAFKGRLRYCHSHGAWFEWTGSIWQRNETQIAFHHARELAREMGRAKKDPKAQIIASKAAFAGAVERYARADRAFAVTAEAWDRDDFLLGTPSGTVNLRTGELRAARQSEGITRSTSTTPTVTATCPRWMQYLDEATGGDAGMIRFLQQWSGYSLTGSTREHALVFAFGPGGNGKSVLIDTLSTILGTYATRAAMETFVAQNHAQHSTDLAMLRGSRLVTASETEKNQKWAEARINSLTGDATITARFMRQDNFSFRPTFKLMIVGNHKPGLQTVNDATRRRFNLIPFTRKPVVPDRELESKLKDEHAGILRWMIDGCLDWQENGLTRPESVKVATAEYFDDQDTFSEWLDECCIVEKDNNYRKETSADLFASWSTFAKAAGEPAGTQKGMAEALDRIELHPVKNVPTASGRSRGFSGITLKIPQHRE